MSKQGIAVFSTAYYPFVGGAELAIKEIVDRLPDCKFSIFTYKFDKNWPSREELANVEIIRLGKGSSGSENYYGQFFNKIIYIFRAWWAAEKSHRRNPLSLTWAVMASYGGFAALLFKIFHPKVPLLLTLQEGDSEEHILKRLGIFYPIWRLLLKKADRISVISNYLGEFARRHGARCPIELVPNGVDLRVYKAHRSNKTNKSYTIITTSRLVHKNGVDILIEAMKYVKHSAELWILGDGPQRQTLELRAMGLRVKFLGQVDPADVYSYLAEADIFVRPSRSEGLGSSFLEAMAAGLPIIGTMVGGIPDFLKDGETGLFTKLDDHLDLASKIDSLLEDEKLRVKIAENGRKLAEKNYSWDFIASKMSEIFDHLGKPSARILIAAAIYPPDIGGPATHVEKLASAFAKNGLEVRIVTYGDARGTNVTGVSRKIPFGIRHLIYFWKCLRLASRSDILYAQDATAAGLPALIAAKVIGKKFFIRIGGDVLWERTAEKGRSFLSLKEYYQKNLHLTDHPFFFRIIRWVLQKADQIIVPTGILKELYVNYYNVPPEKFLVIANPFFAREKSQVIGEEPVFLFAGRFVAYKNLPFLIKVFMRVRDKFKKGKLRLIGAGPEKLIADESVEISQPVNHDRLMENIRSASVCVSPALTEFNPNFILECLSLGKPVLLSRENGLSVPLPEEFLFDPKNEKELGEKLSHFFNKNFYKKSMEKVSDLPIDQTWDKVINEHLKIFNQ